MHAGLSTVTGVSENVADVHAFDAELLTGLLAGGMPPRWVRGLLTSYTDPDQWRAAPVRPGEDPAWRTLSPRPCGSTAVVLGTVGYPWMFALLASPPPVLYVEGDVSLLGPGIGVIGSREMTTLGSSVATIAARRAVALGAPVVTGLAKGVDEHAARTALDAGGTVVGLVGAALDRLDERAATLVADVVNAGGVVACEVPPGTSVSRPSLLARNRLIAALSSPLVVAEATVPSGTLACVRHALELCTPLVVPLPRPAFRSRPSARGLLALSGLAPSSALGFPEHLTSRLGINGFANAICENSQELDDAVAVFWWLRARTGDELARRVTMLAAERSARR